MTDKKWIVDERVGCIVVYQGPRRNCLDGVKGLAYREMGQKGDFSWTWPNKGDAKERACMVAAALNRKEDELEAKEVKLANLREVVRDMCRLVEQIDEAMASRERIEEDTRLVGGYVSTLYHTETAESILVRVISELTVRAVEIERLRAENHVANQAGLRTELAAANETIEMLEDEILSNGEMEE